MLLFSFFLIPLNNSLEKDLPFKCIAPSTAVTAEYLK